MPIPKLTHQQFAVLNVLIDRGETRECELRAALEADRCGKTDVPFHRMMGRLEAAGLVDSRYDGGDHIGQIFPERKYKSTDPGRRAWDEVISYYVARFKATRRPMTDPRKGPR